MNRIDPLKKILTTFKETGIYFLTRDINGYKIPSAADDVGYFFYCTILSNWFVLSPVQASWCFFYCTFAVSLLLIGGSFFCMATSYVEYVLVVLFLGRLAMPFRYLSHIYSIYMLPIAPLALLLYADMYFSKYVFWLSAFLVGLMGSFADNVRIFSALPLYVFVGVYLLLSVKFQKKTKLIFIVFFILGYSLPWAHYSYYLNERSRFLVKNNISMDYNKSHVFWHNIYVGLGFLNNNENIVWSDTCGAKRALEINSKARYPSSLYEKTIKDEVFRLCREKRYFIATTIFAKIGVIFYYFLLYFGFVGLICSWFYPKSLSIELSFLVALGVSALPGILTLPVTPYLIGFITLTVMYSLFGCLYVLYKWKNQ